MVQPSTTVSVATSIVTSMVPTSNHHHNVDFRTVDWNIVKDDGSIATTNRIVVLPIIHNYIAIAGTAMVQRNTFEVVIPATYPNNSFWLNNYDNKYSGFKFY